MTAHAPTLFDQPVTENGRGLSHRRGPDTEQAAAETIRPKSGSQRAKVLEAIVRAGSNGRTDWEIAEATGVLRSAICARRNELVKHGLVQDSGVRRLEKTKAKAIVWVATREGKKASPHFHVLAYPGPRVVTPHPVGRLTADRIAQNYIIKHPDGQVHVRPCEGDCPHA